MNMQLEIRNQDVKDGDYIYLAKAESAPMVEHICQVDYINNNVLATSKCITLIKQMSTNGINVSPIPGFGLISRADRLNSGDKGQILISLNNFDFIGKCNDTEIIKQIDELNSPLITNPEIVNQLKPNDNQDFNGLHLV